CLQPNGIPYNVVVEDIYGNILYSDEWLIEGTTFNVGTAISIYHPNITYGVTDINGRMGSMTFTGPGVVQSGNTFNFTGGGGGSTTCTGSLTGDSTSTDCGTGNQVGSTGTSVSTFGL